MSEKIYAWLLRLYPAHFRKTYREDALQLFRDRSRDERGFFPRLRLWLDLLFDLAISIPQEYRHAQPVFIGGTAQRHWDGVPSFQVLEDESPRPGALLSAALLSLLAVGAISVSIGFGGSYGPPGAWAARPQYRNGARFFAFGRLSETADRAEEEIAALGEPTMDARSPGGGDAVSSGSQSKLLFSSRPRGETSVMDENMKLDAAERQRVIDRVSANLREYYIFPDVARKMADALLAHQKSGDDEAVTEGGAFADLLTRQMRDVSHDMHLMVVYSQVILPDRPLGPTPEVLARYRKALEQNNCTFEKVEILPRNIGYLKLNSFPDPSICRSTAVAAMGSLNHVDAIIFDLRDNGGGYASMVSLIAAYLFDHPEYMYSPRESPTELSWTQSPVQGSRLADKPVYVLTSASTVSAAEQFCYDLKMLKRAAIIGETTRGSAHSGVWHRIDDRFGMGIPETRAINPFSKTDWEGTGVEPDVKVKASDALETAEKLARSKLRKK